MSSSTRKKEKHRLKRKEKRQQMQRVQSRTALQRIAAEGGRLECWIMPADWKQAGIASIRVLGHAPGGRAATAMFLVDFWAVGLKDVFGRGDVPEPEFREGNLDPWIEKSGAVKLDAAAARRMIAGAVRFGRQNSFRMPPEWEKFIVIFGRDILNEIPTADLSNFGIDGGVRYVGTMEFLQKRLTVLPNEFFARPNHHYVMEMDRTLTQRPVEDVDEGDSLDTESMESILSATNGGAEIIAKKAQDWIDANHAEPIPRIDEAARLIMFSLLPASESLRAGADPTEKEMEESNRLVKMMLATQSAEDQQVLAASVEKLRVVIEKVTAGEHSMDRLLEGRSQKPDVAEIRQAGEPKSVS